MSRGKVNAYWFPLSDIARTVQPCDRTAPYDALAAAWRSSSETGGKLVKLKYGRICRYISSRKHTFDQLYNLHMPALQKEFEIQCAKRAVESRRNPNLRHFTVRLTL